MQSKYSGSGSNIHEAAKVNVYINGPAGINVFVTNEVLNNIKDDSLFSLEIQNNKILMKAVYKNEINWIAVQQPLNQIYISMALASSEFEGKNSIKSFTTSCL